MVAAATAAQKKNNDHYCLTTAIPGTVVCATPGHVSVGSGMGTAPPPSPPPSCHVRVEDITPTRLGAYIATRTCVGRGGAAAARCHGHHQLEEEATCIAISINVDKWE